jgi:hypothetical protein
VQLRKASQGRQFVVVLEQIESDFAVKAPSAAPAAPHISAMQHSPVATAVGAPYSNVVLSQQSSPNFAMYCLSSGNSTAAVIRVAVEEELQELVHAQPGANDIDDDVAGDTDDSGHMLRADVQMTGGRPTGQQTYPRAPSTAAIKEAVSRATDLPPQVAHSDGRRLLHSWGGLRVLYEVGQPLVLCRLFISIMNMLQHASHHSCCAADWWGMQHRSHLLPDVGIG